MTSSTTNFRLALSRRTYRGGFGSTRMLIPMRLDTTNIWRSVVMELLLADARRCSSVNAFLNVQTKPAPMADIRKQNPRAMYPPHCTTALYRGRKCSSSGSLCSLHRYLQSRCRASWSLTTMHSPLMTPLVAFSIHRIPNSGEQMRECHL